MKKLLISTCAAAAALLIWTGYVMGADSYTTKYLLRLPDLDVEDEETPWGQKYNNNFTLLDSAISGVAVSTGSSAVDIAALKVSTGAIKAQADALAASTTTLTQDLATEVSNRQIAVAAVAASTGATQAQLDTHTVATSTHGATSANTASRIVMRDGSGNFSAGTITAKVTSLAGGAAGDVVYQSATDTTAFLPIEGPPGNLDGRALVALNATSLLWRRYTPYDSLATIVQRDLEGGFVGMLRGNATGYAELNVLKTGDIMTGPLNTTSSMTAQGGFYGPGAGITGVIYSTAALQADIDSKLAKAGGVMTGPFTISGSSASLWGDAADTGLGVFSYDGQYRYVKIGHGTGPGGSNGKIYLSYANNTTVTTMTAAGIESPGFIGPLTGAASLNVLKAGDTMTGALTTSSSVTATLGFVGPLVGNATTATALAADPSDCTLPNVALGINATGAAQCAQPSNVTGNAATATTATNFSGSLAGDVTGTQGATVVGDNSHTHNFTTVNVSTVTDRIEQVAVYTATNAARTDAVILSTQALALATHLNTVDTIVKRDGSGNFSGGTITATTFTGALNGNANTATTATTTTGNAGTATALAADPADCTSPQFALGINASGAAVCATVPVSSTATLVAQIAGVQTKLDTHTVETSTHGATSANTVGRIVMRDGSGNFTAGTITAALSGNATTATTATTATSATTATNLAGGAAASIPYQSNAGATAMLATTTAGYLLTAGAGAPTWTNATHLNTASAIVKRDTSGNFTSATITATSFIGALSGNATTATTATTTSGNAATATTATSIAAGSAGTIPYQSGAGTTAMLGAGTASYVLTGAGATAPTWTMASAGNTASAIVRRDSSGNFTGTTITATTFTGALNGNALTATTATTAGTTTGNAATATALAADPADCSGANFARGIAASGAAACAQPSDVTGNSATATKLATARTINGVSFDGSANINIATTSFLADGVSLALTGATFSAKPSSVTLQGNTFNGANQLVMLDATGKLPAVDASQLTNLPSTSGGAVLASTQTFTGTNTFTRTANFQTITSTSVCVNNDCRTAWPTTTSSSTILSAYSTTNTTFAACITGSTLTITTTGGRLLANFAAVGRVNTGSYFGLSALNIDGTIVIGGNKALGGAHGAVNNALVNLGFSYMTEPLSAGTHTACVSLRSNGSTVLLANDTEMGASFSIREIK